MLGYHDATLTPHDRHSELAWIGERFAADGPALMTEYDPYGPRWFLRRMDAEGAGELRTRPVPLADGGVLVKAQSADIDAFAYNGLSDYRTLVLRRSPVASRPPSTFQLAWRGHWYDVWRRDPSASPVRVHLGLGMPSDPGAVPPCGEVVGLAQAARPGGALLAAQAPAPVIVGLGEGGACPRLVRRQSRLRRHDPERGRDGWWHSDPSSPGPLVHLARRRAANCRDGPDRRQVGGGNGSAAELRRTVGPRRRRDAQRRPARDRGAAVRRRTATGERIAGCLHGRAGGPCRDRLASRRTPRQSRPGAAPLRAATRLGRGRGVSSAR